MSEALSTLCGICSSARMEQKWLVAPTNRIGHQWIERLIRDGQSVVNLRSTTIARLAFDLVCSGGAGSGRTLASWDALELAIHSVWNTLHADGYLRRLEQTDDLASTVLDSILALRMAGITADQIDVSRMENPAKARDIAQLLRAYAGFLEKHSLCDTADLLKHAIALLKSDSPPVEPRTLFLIPADVSARGLERAFLDAIPRANRRDIHHPLHGSVPESSSIRLLTQLGDPSSSAAPKPDDSVCFFRAVGEANEVREVLRRCVAGEIPLDEVEILHSDSETYIPLIHSLARRYGSADCPDGVPVTFAEGIPASFSRPGRALVAWLRWIHEDYPQRLLVEMISEGLIDCGDDEIGFRYLARLLRPLGVGRSAPNYAPKINEQIRAKQAQLREPRDDDDANAAAACERELKGLKHLRTLVLRLLKLGQALSSGSGPARLKVVEEFLDKQARSVSELDRYAAEAIQERLSERRHWLERLNLTPGLNWIAELPARTPVLGSGPRPGHIHVARLGSGGQSGRSKTFVIGLDDRRFPGAALQDPILLDSERRNLSPDVATSADRLHHKLAEFASGLSRLSGTLTLSWPSQDVLDDRETFPSSVVLSAYRLVSGRRDADLESFNAAVGPPISFTPTAPTQALDETERWLWWLSHDARCQGADQTLVVEGRYPHLARGRHAEREESAGFGPFNGNVPLAGQALNPFRADGPVLSPSTLELAGRCPRAFFFRKALGLYPLDEPEVDDDRWLNAAEFGQLLHETFRDFLEDLTGAGKRPDFERDHKHLTDVLLGRMKRWRADRPPPNENAFRMQVWLLIKTSRIFLQVEADFCRTSEPRHFEVALGLERVGKGNSLDSTTPVRIGLPNGEAIRVRGQIDRVDHLEDHRYSVWDYKTGSAYGYERAHPFNQGRRVQNVLYLHMIEAALRERVDPKAVVERFGYFFPGVRAHGMRMDWNASTLSEGTAVLEKLCTIIADGSFLATNAKDDCEYCDYSTICRDAPRVTGISNRLLMEPGNPQLRHFRELRGG